MVAGTSLSCFTIDNVWLVGQRMPVDISYAFFVILGPLLSPKPNFIQNGQTMQKLKIFAVGGFWLVGLVGKKMVVDISYPSYVMLGPLLAPIPNFI